MSRYILSLDQGTSSSRAVLFDEAGKPVVEASQPFRQIYPQAGWVEHDPEEIWSSQLSRRPRGAAARPRQPASRSRRSRRVGITNQRETTIVWERSTGRAVYNAIVWQCRRTAGMCDELRARGLEPWIRERTGLVVDAYFSGDEAALDTGQRRRRAGAGGARRARLRHRR